MINLDLQENTYDFLIRFTYLGKTAFILHKTAEMTLCILDTLGQGRFYQCKTTYLHLPTKQVVIIYVPKLIQQKRDEFVQCCVIQLYLKTLDHQDIMVGVRNMLRMFYDIFLYLLTSSTSSMPCGTIHQKIGDCVEYKEKDVYVQDVGLRLFISIIKSLADLFCHSIEKDSHKM